MRYTLLAVVMFGSALGGGARFIVSGLIADCWGETFPWNTLVVNFTGSLAIGFIATLTAPDGRVFASSEMRQFFTAGICGGYTTFSSFSWQTLTLAQNGEWFRVGANVVLSVVLCLVAVWLGHIAAAAISR